jgi:nucleoid-associated protein YgaU
MTREHKLALIIGFSLILIVAILLTDHLSPAQEGGRGANASPVSFMNDAASLRPALPAGSMFSDQRERTDDDDDIESMNDDAPAFDIGLTEQLGNSNPRAASNGARSPRNILQLQAPKYALRADTIDASELDGSFGHSDFSLIEMGREIVTDDRGERPDSGEESHGLLPEPARPTHVVRSGETLYGIARRYFNDPGKASLIASLNADLIRDGSTIYVGDVLEIPLTPSVSTPGIIPEPRTESTAKPAATRTYVIKSGDTLMEISADFFGTTKRWHDILKLNPKAISDPDVLIEGRTILLPPDANTKRN